MEEHARTEVAAAPEPPKKVALSEQIASIQQKVINKYAVFFSYLDRIDSRLEEQKRRIEQLSLNEFASRELDKKRAQEKEEKDQEALRYGRTQLAPNPATMPGNPLAVAVGGSALPGGASATAGSIPGSVAVPGPNCVPVPGIEAKINVGMGPHRQEENVRHDPPPFDGPYTQSPNGASNQNGSILHTGSNNINGNVNNNVAAQAPEGSFGSAAAQLRNTQAVPTPVQEAMPVMPSAAMQGRVSAIPASAMPAPQMPGNIPQAVIQNPSQGMKDGMAPHNAADFPKAGEMAVNSNFVPNSSPNPEFAGGGQFVPPPMPNPAEANNANVVNNVTDTNFANNNGGPMVPPPNANPDSEMDMALAEMPLVEDIPVSDDSFAADSDDDTDIENSHTYTDSNLDLGLSGSQRVVFDKERYEEKLLGIRRIMKPSDYLSRVEDEYTSLLMRANLQEMDMSVLGVSVREVKSANEWVIHLPQESQYLCSRSDYPEYIGDLFSKALGYPVKVEFHFDASHGVLAGSPFDLSTAYYHQHLEEERTIIRDDVNFRRLIELLDLKEDTARFDLITAKTESVTAKKHR